MSIHRAAAKVDKSQLTIVQAIEAEGWDCWLIRLPCDVLCWHPVLDIWQPLECKTREEDRRKQRGADKGSESQRKFLRWTEVPVVYTPEEALQQLRAHYPKGVISAELAAYCHQLRQEFEACWKNSPKVRMTANVTPSARQLIELRPHPQFALLEDGP